jgi:hypothetical protein
MLLISNFLIFLYFRCLSSHFFLSSSSLFYFLARYFSLLVKKIILQSNPVWWFLISFIHQLLSLNEFYWTKMKMNFNRKLLLILLFFIKEHISLTSIQMQFANSDMSTYHWGCCRGYFVVTCLTWLRLWGSRNQGRSQRLGINFGSKPIFNRPIHI